MANTKKVLIGAAIVIPVLLGLFVGGLYLGGRVFAAMQKIPPDTVTLMTLHDYWLAYSSIKAVKLALTVGWAVAIGLPVLPVAIAAFILLSGDRRELHGSARFANRQEIRKAGLINNTTSKWPSIIIAKLGDQFLEYFGKDFLSLAAATQGGKGVGLVIPNLLAYPHSIVNLDIKGENWKFTAGFRSMHGQACYLFAPGKTSFMSHRWNSLSYIRRDYEFRMGDIQNIAIMWYPIGDKDKFWPENAQTLFSALVLYMIETPDEPCSMGQLIRLTTPSTGESLDKWMDDTIRAREAKDSPLPRLSVECVDSMRSYMSNTEKTRGDILSTMRAPLKIFRDPILVAATEGDDFDLREVRRKKMSIYIGMTAQDLTRYGTLMNIFFSQLITLNTEVEPEDDPTLKYQCLLLLDEFTALGRINIIRRAISYMASFNMRLVLIYQNKSQIAGKEDGYGPEGADTLLSNCTTKLMFQPDDVNDAKEYSEILGYQTVKSKSKSRSRQSGKPGTSENESDSKRALMLPQELRELGFEKIIINKKNCKPILADKIIYWSDPVFAGRVSLPTPPVPRLTIVRAVHADRLVRADEVADLDADDITNTAEILKAIGDAIGFDFSPFLLGDTEAEAEVEVDALAA
jgi:type IV secretion system protein VirD4